MLTRVRGHGIAAGVLALLVLVGYAPAQERTPAAPNEVTLKGMVLNNAHTGEKEKSVFVYVLDGPPEVKAEFDKIMAEYYPEKGLDGEAARKLQDQFTARLKYFIDGPLADKLAKDATYGARQVMAVTGAVSEKDGKKWITASKCEPTPFQYPGKMLAPDKPFVMPDKPPLVLTINETLSLKCIYVPPGKFFMGEPYFQCPHWMEDPPHMVTLTKPYYMAEHVVPQEIYEAVMGNNPSKVKGPKLPVQNVDCVNVYKFCELLSQKTGHKVRYPTAAEWDYAARVGTSNPPFEVKYKEHPNAWGFYDIPGASWERVGDATVSDYKDMVDPVHTPPQDRTEAGRATRHQHIGKGQAGYAIGEFEYINSDPGNFRFRVVVEAEPAATAPATGPGTNTTGK